MNVLVIYNPNSTGDSEANARAFAEELRAEQKGNLTVRIKRTTHAGHLEEIAREQARSGREIVLIASSGDGGYHELINGALSDPKSKVITGVLPSGNANDHYSSLGSDDMAARLARREFARIDTIKVTAVQDGKAWARYAHSYAGLGVSAVAAEDMTRQRPNVLTEKWLLIKSLVTFRSAKIIPENHTHMHRYSSVIFANIPVMSKTLKVAQRSQPDDGKFEINRIRLVAKPWLLIMLLRAATVGLKSSKSIESYSFKTIYPTRIQLDGEVFVLDKDSDVRVESAHQNLRCVL